MDIDIDWHEPSGTPPTTAVDIIDVTVSPSPRHTVGGTRVTIWVDVDGDGVIDVQEDTNGNGVLDPGETDVDGDGKADDAEPNIQQIDGMPSGPPPPGAGPGTGTIPGTIHAPPPPPGGKINIRVRVDADVRGPGGGNPEPVSPEGGVKITPIS